jgi:hypothetical protein
VNWAVTSTTLPPPLSRGQRFLLSIEILATYGHARWLMRRRELPQAVETLRDVQRPYGRYSADDREDALRLARATIRLLHLLPMDSRCLVRSLVLTALLARRGIPATLHLGVRAQPSFAAHAWVEHGGEPVLPTEPEYEPLLEV